MSTVLKEYLNYNSKTGLIIWIKSPKARIKVGDVAGYSYNGLHGTLQLQGKRYLLHRLAWYLYYGNFPIKYLDHVDGDPMNNKIENLREVTPRQNQQNQICHREGHILGTCFNKPRNKWHSSIYIKGKKKTIGNFNTQQEANEAYLNEVNKLCL